MQPLEPQELEALAIFPLPNLVFFPNTLLPLHIFEPRYRKMIGDVLAQRKPLAVAQLAPSLPDVSERKPAIHPVAGVGRIVESKRMPDGRYYLVLEGVGKIQVVEELETAEPYRLVNATLLTDVLPDADMPKAQAARAILQSLTFSLSRSNPRLSNAIATALSTTREPGVVADVIASLIVMDPARRQSLLETVSITQRLELCADALAELVGQESPPVSPQLFN